MHVRHLLTATLLVSGLHAGKQDNPSNIPEHEREAYRTCVMYQASNEMKKTALQELNKAHNNNDFEGKMFYPNMFIASDLVNESTKMQPELAGKPNGYCANLIKKNVQRTHTGWLKNTYEHPKEFWDIANTTKNCITEETHKHTLKIPGQRQKSTNKDEDNT